VTIAFFLQLCQILAALGGAGVALVTIRKDIDARLAAGTLKPGDPLPAEHLPAVQHRLEHGIQASDDVWNATHGPEGG
jgi:hypothetical protein